MTIRNALDITDPLALGPYQIVAPNKTATSYNQPGLPKPPAGWGKILPMTDSVDGDDEGPESRDEA